MSNTWGTGPIIGFDLETTGVDPLTARMVSAAIILDVPGAEPVTREWLVNPGIDIPLQATACHGISTEEAQSNGVSPYRACTDILALLNGYAEFYGGTVPLVAFNAVYDLTVLDREIQRHVNPGGLVIPLPIIDPMVIDRNIVDKYRRGRRTLTATTAAYGLVIKGAHTATGDVTVSIALARAIAYKYPKLIGNVTLADLQVSQAAAHREFAKSFTKYRRAADPEFVCDGDWPVMGVTA